MNQEVLINTICITCGAEDKQGLTNFMCVDCFDMSLDIGKTGAEVEKKKERDRKALAKRRRKNGYWKY